MSNSNLIAIFQTRDSFEADFVKSCFDNENIPCFVKTNDACGVLPHLGFQRGIEIFINEDDLELANQVLQRIKSGSNSD